MFAFCDGVVKHLGREVNGREKESERERESSFSTNEATLKIVRESERATGEERGDIFARGINSVSFRRIRSQETRECHRECGCSG